MKTLLSWVLYQIGHLISILMRCDLFAWLYPFYNRIMSLSSNLDTKDKVWHN
jgi:hypothetical protein